MFSENPGPTALRRDLVLALSFATAEVSLEGRTGVERSLAALSGVWNGTKAYVAILIRCLDHPDVRRFTYSHPLHSPDDMWSAVEEGMAFIESMGFSMDPAEFMTLPEPIQEARLEAWDVLRKPSAETPVAQVSRRLSQVSTAPAAGAALDGAAPGGAVLGRVAVVRGSALMRARLLAQY
jgi:hypothetical protein